MSATELAASWLRRFHAGEDLPDGLAFRSALGEANLDYSADSLERIDHLLRRIRQQSAPEFRAFLQQVPNRNFVFLLCFYIGTAVARYRLQAVRWFYRDELRGVLSAAEIAALPAHYSSSIICTFWERGRCAGHFRPLAILLELLFETPGERGVLAAASEAIQRSAQLPLLRPPASGAAMSTSAADARTSALYRLGSLAGAHFAMCCRMSLEAGAPAEPLLALEAQDGARIILDGAAAGGGDPLAACRARLGAADAKQRAGVLAYPGVLNLPRFRCDALLLEAHSYDPPARAVIGVPYRAAHLPGGFALHQARVLESSGRREDLALLEAGFFAGIDSFMPPGLWAASFADENEPENLAMRVRQQAAALEQKAANDGNRTASPDSDPHPLADIRLADLDIAVLVAALPPADFAYPKMRLPEWMPRDPLMAAFVAMPALLRQGRVVWGHVVEADRALHKHGDQGAAGEVIYDPAGRASAQELQDAAARARVLRAELVQPVAAVASEGGLTLAGHADDPSPRPMGLSVPESISHCGLQFTSVYFERRHLPGGKLGAGLLPVLVSEDHPGCVMVLPARWWPDALLDLWRGPEREEARKAWEKTWAALAQPRAAADQQALDARRDAVSAYVADGAPEDHIAIMLATGHPGFEPDCQPAPLEWEWGLDLELRDLARLHLAEVERARARGQAPDWAQARRAHALMRIVLMIGLHRLKQAAARGLDAAQFALQPDDIRHVALGLVAGCEQSAYALARLLCDLWQSGAAYRSNMAPDSRAIFTLFAQFLDLPAPPLPAGPKAAKLEALLQGERWCQLEAADLKPLLEAACTEHTEQVPAGEFCGLPIALVLMLKLREKLGLENPALSHPLLAATLAPWPQPMNVDLALDRLLRSMLERMQGQGYDEAKIMQLPAGLGRVQNAQPVQAAPVQAGTATSTTSAAAESAVDKEVDAAAAAPRRSRLPPAVQAAAFVLWVLFLVWLFGPY
ncbi:MAG: hypothetical protein KF778_22220 [Rhodocyclaceae bacterium]|nr:hypothetical protein [Rhodocyclaceae bacterium]